MSLTTDPNKSCLREHRPDGQQKCYLILSDEEIAKGFVRPVRTSYIHVGKPICGQIQPSSVLGGYRRVCFDSPGHEGECWRISKEVTQPEADRLERTKSTGCGTETTMGLKIAETYARDPKFYNGTFCCACSEHFSLLNSDGSFAFLWEDGSGVGE